MSALADGSTTVTIFADHGPLVSEISEEIRSRGASTHTVSVEAGWIDSISRALLVLDSAAGMSAVRALCDLADADARVVALITDDCGLDAEDLCDQCIERHDLVMLRADADDVVTQIVDQVVGTAS